MKIWSEVYDETKHHNPMGWSGPEPVPTGELTRHWSAHPSPGHKVLFVRVCGFTFEFHGPDQIKACLEFYSRKVLPSRRRPVYTENLGGDHWETQRWFDRLPMCLREEAKRKKVVKALDAAVTNWERF